MRAANPLVAPPPAQVPLAHAPLIHVLAVVRFPLIAEIETPEFAGTFQRALRAQYPVAEREVLEVHTTRSSGAVAADHKTVLRFVNDAGWRASLARDFLALETTRYVSRADFLERLRFLLGALTKQVTPARVDRLGVRYIDRIQGEDLANIGTLIHPELAGVAKTSFASQCTHSLSDNLFDLDDAQLAGRWGLLPPNATPDPSTIEPIAQPSWILDLDMSTKSHTDFTAEAIVAKAEAFAARIYTFFRWAVTDAFLQRFGGTA